MGKNLTFGAGFGCCHFWESFQAEKADFWDYSCIDAFQKTIVSRGKWYWLKNSSSLARNDTVKSYFLFMLFVCGCCGCWEIWDYLSFNARNNAKSYWSTTLEKIEMMFWNARSRRILIGCSLFFMNQLWRDLSRSMINSTTVGTFQENIIDPTSLILSIVLAWWKKKETLLSLLA